MKRTIWTGVALLAWAFPALAQDASSIRAAVGAPPESGLGQVFGDANFGQINGDWFATINVGLNLDFGIVGFGIQAPLHLRLTGDGSKDYGGVLRHEDWDEFSDYLKIIRYFRFGHKGDLIFAQLGDLPGATLGHGTIVNRYYNNTDLNHYKMGLQLDVNTDYAGVETLVNGMVQWNLFGGRAYLRPWSFVDKDSYLNNLAVGFSVVTDVTAPFNLAKDTTTNQPIIEDDLPKVQDTKAATVLGGDIEFRILNTEIVAITPYMDLNHIMDAGTGYHAGVLTTFHIPVITMDLKVRVEYRYFNGDYIPAYFDSFYEIQKFGYPFKDEAGTFGPPHAEVDNVPKRQVLGNLGGKALNGYYAELVFDFLGLFAIGGSYDDYDGPYNSNLRLYLDVPALKVFKFAAYYYRHNFEGAGNAFKFDDKSLFLVEAKYQIVSFLYLVGQWWRIWQLDTNQASGTYGQYVAIDDWSLGIGMSYSF